MKPEIFRVKDKCVLHRNNTVYDAEVVGTTSTGQRIYVKYTNRKKKTFTITLWRDGRDLYSDRVVLEKK